METIEQTLDNWLEEYSANKNLRYRLTTASKENPKGITPDTVTIILSKREIEILAKGLDIILQSNKESIIDCSYNFIQARKNKNNAKQIIEDNTHLEQINNALEEVRQKDETKEQKIKNTISIKGLNKFDKYFNNILKTTKDNIIIIFDKSLVYPKERILLTCLIRDITGITLSDARNVFNNKVSNGNEEKQFILSISDCNTNYTKLREYIANGGILKIKILQ